jgi:hypothetical protein
MAIKFRIYFPASNVRGVFLPRYVALIRDNGMVCEPFIHGTLILAQARWLEL